MHEIVANSIHAAPAHYVKVAVEVDANGADSGGWHVWTLVPAARRTTHANEARWVLVLECHVGLPLTKRESD